MPVNDRAELSRPCADGSQYRDVAPLRTSRKCQQEGAADDEQEAEHDLQDQWCREHPSQRLNARRNRHRVRRCEVDSRDAVDNGLRRTVRCELGDQDVAGRIGVERLVRVESHRGTGTGRIRRHHDANHCAGALPNPGGPATETRSPIPTCKRRATSSPSPISSTRLGVCPRAPSDRTRPSPHRRRRWSLVAVDGEGTDMRCRQLRNARSWTTGVHDVGVGFDVGIAKEPVIVHSRRAGVFTIESRLSGNDARADETGHAHDPGRECDGGSPRCPTGRPARNALRPRETLRPSLPSHGVVALVTRRERSRPRPPIKPPRTASTVSTRTPTAGRPSRARIPGCGSNAAEGAERERAGRRSPRQSSRRESRRAHMPAP